MKYTLSIISISLTVLSFAQNISKESVSKLYIQALQDFQELPLAIHELDKKILVAKPDCEINELPEKIGTSNVEWICLDLEFIESIKKKAKKNNGRSAILISYKQPAEDTITVRIDQWRLENLDKGFSFKPINEEEYKEYLNKKHDYRFANLNGEWILQAKENNLNPKSDFEKQTEEIFQKGVQLAREGKTEEALKNVEISMLRDSSMYQRYKFRADLKIKLGMYESAIKDISTCIERCDCRTRKSHVSHYYMERAKIHFMNNDFDSALGDMNRSFGSSTDNWKSYAMRGKMHYTSKDYERALFDLDKSIELNNKEPTLYLLRGLLHSDLGNKEAACSDIRIAAEKELKEAKNWLKKNCN